MVRRWVAASASLPLVVGPVTLRLGSTYWHLGDGGLFDNTGIETLEHLMFNKLARQDSTGSALILALDSARQVGEEELAREKDFWLSSHPDLVVDIPMGRAEAYHQAVWQELREKQFGERIERVDLRYMHAGIRPDQLPDSCASIEGLCDEQDCAESIARYVGAIPTHLKIKDCDADLIELAAHQVVHAEWSGRSASSAKCRFGVSRR